MSTKADIKIVTIDQDPKKVLGTYAQMVENTPQGLNEAKHIAESLKIALNPLMPAAGLAAHQIGISKQVFIYSWNREPDQLEVVINPTFEALSEDCDTSWEACFSTLTAKGACQAALLKRYLTIRVHYLDLEGNTQIKRLEGFAAKVFQHEYDHLQGQVCVAKPNVEVKTFSTKAEFIEFMSNVKQNDSQKYIKPIKV